MKIAFYQPHLDIQGTGVAYFDYAYYNEIILGNKSYMLYDENHPGSHPLAIKKFQDAIETIALPGRENMTTLEAKLNELNVDAVYIQKCGKKDDGRFVNNKPMLIHVVGVNNDPHGEVYAYVSQWLSDHCSDNTHPVVPYIINLPNHNKNFRDQLNIPAEATVIGRIGGFYSWNIPFASQAVIDSVNTRDDIYYLFVQTEPFIDHPRVLHLESFADLNIKRRFINTCDAFLHARMEGESFGAAVGEFSICNKPVITYANSPERNHITQLKDTGIYYTDYNTLLDILISFKYNPNKNWNMYNEFTPERVMSKFDQIFLNKIRKT